MSSSVEPRRPSKPDEPEAKTATATMAVINPVQRKSSIGKLDSTGSSTTIALGGDTYTIVATRKTSSSAGPRIGGSNALAAASDEANILGDRDNGETIRIFRRSRSGRPHSSSRSDSLMCGDSEVSASGLLSSSAPGRRLFLASSASVQHESVPVSASASAEERRLSRSSAAMRTNHVAALQQHQLPAPESAAAVKEAFQKLRQAVSSLRDLKCSEAESLIFDLEYVTEVVQSVVSKAEDEAEDDLSELQSEAVPAEVRKWLASTFAKQEATHRRPDGEPRPSFRSVANAIRTGIFIERIYRRMSSSQLMTVPPEVAKALKRVSDYSFDTFSFGRECKGSPLRFMAYDLLTSHGCLHKYKIPPSVLETMLVHVEQGYAANGNPYHNNMHACDVLQSVNYFISLPGLSNWLTDLEIFTSLMAAIIHDYDHSGTTNNFHVNSSSDLALLYNDRAVLENHHVSAFFRTLQQRDCNIFSNMQRSDFREFRNLIIEMVLHTDMSQHFSQLKAMKTVLQQQFTGEPSFDKTKVLCLLLHSCDVSHPSKRWDLHHEWTARCLEEFFEQGDREAEMGLEYSPLCDRHNTMVPQSQIGFIDFIVSPTMHILGDVLEAVLKALEQQQQASSKRQLGQRNVLESIRSEDDGGDSGSNGGGGSKSEAADRQLLKRPWVENLAANRARWQEKNDAGEQGIEPSNAASDSRPSSVTSITGKSRPNSATTSVESTSAKPPSANQSIYANARARLAGTAATSSETSSVTGSNGGVSEQKEEPGTKLTGLPEPAPNTQLKDIVADLTPNVFSPPDSPVTWDFSEKEVSGSLRATPPRPGSASLCSPPLPRRVPISVDHHLRKPLAPPNGQAK